MAAALATGLLTVVVGVVAGGAVRNRPLVPRALVALTALVAAVPCLLFIAYYTHALDGAAYYEWRSRPSTDALAGLIGFAAGVVVMRGMPSRMPAGVMWRERAVRAAAGAVVVVVLLVLAFAKPVLTRMPRAWVNDRWSADGSVCLQSTPSTCGPCAAATVLKALGDAAILESTLAEEASATTSGTLNWLLVRAVRERGYRAELRDPASLREVEAPAIIGVRVGYGIGHFLAYLGRDDAGRYVIGEPLQGKRALSAAEFASAYAFDNFAIEIAPLSAP